MKPKALVDHVGEMEKGLLMIGEFGVDVIQHSFLAVVLT